MKLHHGGKVYPVKGLKLFAGEGRIDFPDMEQRFRLRNKAAADFMGVATYTTTFKMLDRPSTADTCQMLADMGIEPPPMSIRDAHEDMRRWLRRESDRIITEGHKAASTWAET